MQITLYKNARTVRKYGSENIEYNLIKDDEKIQMVAEQIHGKPKSFLSDYGLQCNKLHQTLYRNLVELLKKVEVHAWHMEMNDLDGVVQLFIYEDNHGLHNRPNANTLWCLVYDPNQNRSSRNFVMRSKVRPRHCRKQQTGMENLYANHELIDGKDKMKRIEKLEARMDAVENKVENIDASIQKVKEQLQAEFERKMNGMKALYEGLVQ